MIPAANGRSSIAQAPCCGGIQCRVFLRLAATGSAVGDVAVMPSTLSRPTGCPGPFPGRSYRIASLRRPVCFVTVVEAVHSRGRGSVWDPLTYTSKCRWHPVEAPVVPT